MNEIPDFESAVASLRRFLEEQGHPSGMLWVFREDIWKRASDDVVLKFPSQAKNLALAKKVFDEGRRKGLVNVHAIATVDDQVAARFGFRSFQARKFKVGIAA